MELAVLFGTFVILRVMGVPVAFCLGLSAVAGVSAMGSALTPIMRKNGYDDDFAVNVTATASTTGLLIPPSHNMIIYLIAAGGGVSIVSLFLAGVVPGILVGWH